MGVKLYMSANQWRTETAKKESQNFSFDSLNELELKMKETWSQYISYLDKNGLDETAKALKHKYLQIYQNYQKNKIWRNIVTNK